MDKRRKKDRIWLVVVVSLLGAAAGLFQIETYDTMFHLAAGRLILETFKPIVGDPFSFTFGGEVWHNHSPLFQIVIAMIHKWAGFVGLSVLQAFMAGALTLASLLAGRRFGADLPMACLLAILPVFVFRPLIIARPHVFSFFALQACLAIILSAEKDGKLGRLLFLPLVYAFWLESHGSHPVQIALTAYWAVSAALYRNKKFALALGGSVVVCLAVAAILKPDSFDLAGTHFVSGFLAGQIGEWQTLSVTDLFHSWSGIGFLFLLVATLMGLVANSGLVKIKGLDSNETDKLPYHHSLALLGFLVFSLTSARMTPFFILGAAALWLPRAAWTLDKLTKPPRARMVERWSSLAKKSVADAIALCLAAVLAAGCLCYPSKLNVGVGLQKERFPFAALDFMRQNNLGQRVYNAYNWGGFLIFNKYPPGGVFVDGRAITLYSTEFLENFVKAYTDFDIFEGLAAKYQVDSVLMPIQSRRTGTLLRYLEANPRWRLAYHDEMAAFFVLKE